VAAHDRADHWHGSALALVVVMVALVISTVVVVAPVSEQQAVVCGPVLLR
jgi:hypothetical protein